jgi:hypothetical protein
VSAKIKAGLFLASAIALNAGNCDALTLTSTLTTNFASNNGGSAGGAVYFDLEAKRLGTVITGFDFNFAQGAGTTGTLDLYITSKGVSALGNEGNSSAFTLIRSGNVTAAGQDSPTTFNIDPFRLESGGRYGFALVAGSTLSHRYTNGSTGDADIFASPLGLTLYGGSASNVPFTPGFFSPRIVNTNVNYSVPGPLPVFGLVGAFAYSRKLRKRIEDHRKSISSVSL